MFLNVTPWFIWAERPYCEFLITSASLRSFALAVRQGLNPDHPPFTPSQGQGETVVVSFRLTNGFHPQNLPPPWGSVATYRCTLVATISAPPRTTSAWGYCGVHFLNVNAPLRGFHCPLGSVQRPKSSKLKHFKAISSIFKHYQAKTLAIKQNQAF